MDGGIAGAIYGGKESIQIDRHQSTNATVVHRIGPIVPKGQLWNGSEYKSVLRIMSAPTCLITQRV